VKNTNTEVAEIFCWYVYKANGSQPLLVRFPSDLLVIHSILESFRWFL